MYGTNGKNLSYTCSFNVKIAQNLFLTLGHIFAKPTVIPFRAKIVLNHDNNKKTAPNGCFLFRFVGARMRN